jgi:hypothetical protein
MSVLQDNASSQTAAHTAHTAESFSQLNLELLKHPLYSSDVAPYDCHLFCSLKDALRGRHFTSDQEVN